MSDYILCRRNLADIGAHPNYCCKPINKQNPMDWCEECRVRLPIWPQEAP